MSTPVRPPRGGSDLLQLNDLSVELVRGNAHTIIVDRATLSVGDSEFYGLVGQSGSGKTTLAHAVLRLPPGEIVGGEIRFDDLELVTLSEDELNRVRGRRIGMVYQNAASSLNPTFTVGTHVAEMLQVHRGLGRRASYDEASMWLSRVGLAGYEQAYPHELSGGQAQRACIAIAIAPEPELLIADEPTSALDVTVQEQILRLLSEYRRERGASVLLITHDLGVIAQTADRVGVMVRGRVVEELPVEELFTTPSHPYTRQMLDDLRLTHPSTP